MVSPQPLLTMYSTYAREFVSGDSLIVQQGSGQARHCFKTYLPAGSHFVIEMQNLGHAGAAVPRQTKQSLAGTCNGKTLDKPSLL